MLVSRGDRISVVTARRRRRQWRCQRRLTANVGHSFLVVDRVLHNSCDVTREPELISPSCCLILDKGAILQATLLTSHNTNAPMFNLPKSKLATRIWIIQLIFCLFCTCQFVFCSRINAEQVLREIFTGGFVCNSVHCVHRKGILFETKDCY